MGFTRNLKGFKTTTIIAVLKPGKPANEAGIYRPFSLLDVRFKLWKTCYIERCVLS